MEAALKNRLKELRSQRRLSCGQVAIKLNIDRSYVSKLEKGEQDPSAKIMLRLARLFECPVEDLFYEDSAN
jgi:putative transcriptional regulator